LSFKWKYWT